MTSDKTQEKIFVTGVRDIAKTLGLAEDEVREHIHHDGCFPVWRVGNGPYRSTRPRLQHWADRKIAESEKASARL